MIIKFTAPPYYQTDSCIISLDLSLEEAPGISEDVGAILAVYGFIRTKSLSMLCRKSWVFSGHFGFLSQGKLTGWVCYDKRN